MSIIVDEEEPLVDVEDAPFEPRDVKVRQEDVQAEFDIYDFLGRGKFGEVKRCVEKDTGKEFAAKFIMAPRPQDKVEVQNEVEIMKKLQHKRLLQLYDCFCNKTEMCLVLEIILGGELFDRVIDDDFILTERACVVFMRQICEGVEYMHSRNIIHLDMKPENILCLSRTGNRIKIIDFGLAREYNPKKDLRVLFGTPEFMAPEVVQYEPISFATDMWSVGVICYVLLSGLSPFMGDNDSETLVNVIKGEYDFNYAEFSDVTEPAKDLIRKLLVKDKTKRLTAQECLQHPWLRREKPKHTHLDLSKRRLKRFVYRRKWQKIVNAIIALKRMGVQLDSLRNRRTMTFKKQESIFGWDAKKGAPSAVKNGMRAPDVEEMTEFAINKADSSESDDESDESDEEEKPSQDGGISGETTVTDPNDVDASGVSVSATFVLSPVVTPDITDSNEVASESGTVVTVEAEHIISLEGNSCTEVSEVENNLTIVIDPEGKDEKAPSKPSVADETVQKTTNKVEGLEEISSKDKIKGKPKDKQTSTPDKKNDKRSENSKLSPKVTKDKTSDAKNATKNDKAEEKQSAKEKVREKAKDKGKVKEKSKEENKQKSSAPPWARMGRPEPGILRHVPIRERTKPAPKQQEVPWSKRRIRKQDGIHLHTLKDWRDVTKAGNSKASKHIPAEAGVSTVETATESPEREHSDETLLNVDGARSRKNSDARKNSDTAAPEAPAKKRVCRKSNKIEIENGRPKSQNLDNVDVMGEQNSRTSVEMESQRTSEGHKVSISKKTSKGDKDTKEKGMEHSSTEESRSKVTEKQNNQRESKFAESKERFKDQPPTIKVEKPPDSDSRSAHLKTEKGVAKKESELGSQQEAFKDKPPDSRVPVVQKNKNEEKLETSAEKPVLKLHMKHEPQYCKDNTKPKTPPDPSKKYKPNFKKDAKQDKVGRKLPNWKPFVIEPQDQTGKQHVDRIRSKSQQPDERSQSPKHTDPVFPWQQPGIRNTSVPPEDKKPFFKPTNEQKSTGMYPRSKFTSEDNLTSNYTKTLMQNSPWSRSISLHDGDGYRSHPHSKPFHVRTPDIFPKIQEVPSSEKNTELNDILKPKETNDPKKISGPLAKTQSDLSTKTPIVTNLGKKSTETGTSEKSQSLVDSGYATLPRKKPGTKIKIVAKTLSDTREETSSKSNGNQQEGEGSETGEQAEVRILSIQERIRLLKSQKEENEAAQPKVQFRFGSCDPE